MSQVISLLQKNLLTWYKHHRRDLPWRNTTDPYAIWVSEVMLQQTRVDTVIAYWHRFLETFPTLADLAKADEQAVLQIWQGLGYYRRAKLMHKAAKQVLSQFDGNLPKTLVELIKLSGFGPYTAGAVASIAFGEKVPCVDGNVIRVLSRIFASHADVTPHAFALAKHRDPSSINQSLMELGALICLPKNPKCSSCPVQMQCQANQQQTIDLYPAPRKKPNVKNVFAAALILHNPQEQTFLLQQRPSSGRWPNMWEFPYFEFEENDMCVEQFLTTKFPKAANFAKKGKVRHQLTHQNIHVDVYFAETFEQSSGPTTQKWIKDVSTLPTSVLAKKIQQTLG
ncbi:MAG: A/G-specific adenine glycosylase [Bdellovibrionota bacterium]